MTSTRLQFSAGDFQCIAIKDGTFPYPTDWFFSNVPKAQLEDNDLRLNHIVGPLHLSFSEDRETRATRRYGRRQGG
jgi:hypothetical protein